MGEESCGAPRASDEFRGIELDEWLEETIEQLRDDFLAAMSAGDDEKARQLVERFESSLDRLPRKDRDEILSETTVWLGEELKIRGLSARRTPHEPGQPDAPPSDP
jgi:hypothetical protein